MNTKQTKPTPGPWLVSSSVLVCNPEAKIIAQCANFSGLGVEINEAIANARLIASAPDLLEALESCMDAMINCGYMVVTGTPGQQMLNRAYQKACLVHELAKGPL